MTSDLSVTLGMILKKTCILKKVELSFNCIDAVSSSSVRIWSTSLCDGCTVVCLTGRFMLLISL